MNWLDRIVEQRKDFESPLSFWKWAGIASISAVVKDNVWLSRQQYNLYPNIYVMFHAESGLKKGPAVNMAKRLVKLVGNTQVISGRSSIQGILKELGGGYSEPSGKVIRKSTAFICSSELSSSIVEDKVATTILTDLYDRSYNVGEWRSLLKMESFDLKNPTITMLTATNAAHVGSFFEGKDIRGGYFARTFIVYEKEESRINSLLVPLEKELNDELDAQYLRQLDKLKGPFQPLGSRIQSEEFKRARKNVYSGETEYFTDAGLFYEEWYHDFKEKIRSVKDPTGTLNRFGDSVLKVAMILSLARSTDLIITLEAMEEAVETCEKLVGNVRRVTLGKDDEGDVTKGTLKTIMIEELMQRDTHQISRLQLNKKYWLQANVNEWDEVCLSLEAAGFIKINTVGNQIVYEMTETARKEMENFLKGKV